MTRVDAAPDILPSDHSSTFTNTGAAGINRLVVLDDLLLVDNIGRNFEIRQIAHPVAPTWIQRALYDVTIFPGEDNPSILDSDVHGAFLTADRRWLLIGNHFGRVRCFGWPFPDSTARYRPVPSVELQLPGDTERLVFDGKCFITSSPRGAYTADPARPGIFISESVLPLLTSSRANGLRRLECRSELAHWGVITALALESRTSLLAVAAEKRLALFAPDAGEWPGNRLWETQLVSGIQWLAFDGRGHLVAGGHDGQGSDDEGGDWNACRGGTLTMLTLAGAEVARVPLPDGTAWGYGSDPIVFSESGEAVYVVDRVAGVHALDPIRGSSSCLAAGVEGISSLGIGHAVRAGRYLYAGFSRGGYRVFRYRLA